MKLKIRIHDIDGDALNRAEALIRNLAREYRFNIDVCQVIEILEHGRLGIDGCLPVLEINEVYVSKGEVLSEETVAPFFKGLAALRIKNKIS